MRIEAGLYVLRREAPLGRLGEDRLPGRRRGCFVVAIVACVTQLAPLPLRAQGVLGAPAVASAGTEASSPVSAEELAALWEAQRSEIATAEIRFRCFNSSLQNPLNSPERIAELLREHNLAEHPERLEPFLLALIGHPPAVVPPWQNMSIVASGRHRRFEDAWCTFVTNGDVEAVLTPRNRQLDLLPVGKSPVHYYGLADIRWTPPPTVSAGAWEFVRLEGDDVVFQVPPVPGGTPFQVESSVDTGSGIVTHSLTRQPDGAPAVETYQRGLQVHSSGIVFPHLRMDVQYAAGSARSARVILVDGLRLNESMADSTFRLSVSGGTAVIDYRGSEKEAYRIVDDAADALALPIHVAQSPAVAPVRGSARATSQYRWTALVVVHVLAALTAGWLLWRRKRSSPSRQS